LKAVSFSGLDGVLFFPDELERMGTFLVMLWPRKGEERRGGVTNGAFGRFETVHWDGEICVFEIN
jgi:hypothetical protein